MRRMKKKEARPTSVSCSDTSNIDNTVYCQTSVLLLIEIAANMSHRSLKVLAKLLSFIFLRPYSCSSGDSGKRVAILQKP